MKKILVYSAVVFIIALALGYGIVFLYSICPICSEKISGFSKVGDAFAGLSAIVLSAFAIAVTFAAFWIQYKANQDMLRNNDKMQAERQFYEMLGIHRENVEKIEFSYLGSENETINLSRDGHTHLGYEKHSQIFHDHGHKALRWLLMELKFIYNVMSNKVKFAKIYEIFFEGLNGTSGIIQSEKNDIQKVIDFVQKPSIKKPLIQNFDEILKRSPFKDNRCLIMQGHRDVLNSYYRHLYLIVKSVVTSKFFEEKEKIAYLKILRAQMTSEEQTLLFFNWYSGYGKEWESKKGNRFFSKYRMVHNMDHQDFEFVLSEEQIYSELSYMTYQEKKNFFEFNQRKTENA